MNTETAVAKKETTSLSPIDKARRFLDDPKTKAELAKACRDHITPDRQLRLVLTACNKVPKLLECFQTAAGQRSIGLAMLTASQFGLELDGKSAHLLPFRDNRADATLCTLIAGYQGLLGLCYNHPAISSINVDAVYENDKLTYKRGIDIVLEHEPVIDGEPGELRAAYAVCKMKNGGTVVVFMPKREIERVKKSSRGADDARSPWMTAPGEMWKKTALRQLCKIIPQSSEMRELIQKEDELENREPFIDVQATPESRFQKITAPSERDCGESDNASEPAVDSTPEPVAEPEPATPAQVVEQPKPADSLSAKAESYYKKEGQTLDQVVVALAKLKPKIAETITAKTWAELTVPQLECIYSTRYGVSRAIKDATKS